MDTSDAEDLDIPHADDLDDFVDGPLYKKTKNEILKEISRNINLLKKGEKLKLYFAYDEDDKEMLHDVLKKLKRELKSLDYETKLRDEWGEDDYKLTFSKKKEEEEEWC